MSTTDTGQVETATAYIATSDSPEEVATVAIVDGDGAEIAKLGLGQYGYMHEAVEAIRAAGWRVYPDTIVPDRRVDSPRGYFRVKIFRG